MSGLVRRPQKFGDAVGVERIRTRGYEEDKRLTALVPFFA